MTAPSFPPRRPKEAAQRKRRLRGGAVPKDSPYSILFIPAGSAKLASTRTQVFERVAELRARRINADILDPQQSPTWRGNKLRALLLPLRAPRYDILFFQKTLHPRYRAAMRAAARRGQLVAFHTDDWFDDAAAALNDCFASADISFICSRFLAAKVRAAGGNPVLLPAVVDPTRFKPARRRASKGPLVLGWVGASLYENLLLIKAPLARLAARRRILLRIVGAPPPAILAQLRAAGIPLEATGFLPKERVPAVVSSFDIALMPAPDNALHRAAMPTKLLEYMAAGLPCVASRVGEIPHMLSGTGLLARTSKDWNHHLSRLAASAPLRSRLGRAARKRILDHYSLQATTDLLLAELSRGLREKQNR